MRVRSTWHLTWLSLRTVLLVIALISVSAACVAQCVGFPCQRTVADKSDLSTPPCHKKAPSQAPAEPCKQSLLVASAGPVAKAAGFVNMVLDFPEGSTFLPGPEIRTELASRGTAPPDFSALRSLVVLRI